MTAEQITTITAAITGIAGVLIVVHNFFNKLYKGIRSIENKVDKHEVERIAKKVEDMDKKVTALEAQKADKFEVALVQQSLNSLNDTLKETRDDIKTEIKEIREVIINSLKNGK